jgi:hypothetical protein
MNPMRSSSLLGLMISVFMLNLSGIFGWLMQKAYPRTLKNTGVEVIYEKIPAVLGQLRDQAEATVLECGQQTGSAILGQYYVETLHWFFPASAILLESRVVWRQEGTRLGVGSMRACAGVPERSGTEISRSPDFFGRAEG